MGSEINLIKKFNQEVVTRAAILTPITYLGFLLAFKGGTLVQTTLCD